MPVLYVAVEAFLGIEIGITGGTPIFGQGMVYLHSSVRCFGRCRGRVLANFDC
jgi:hypothetical protein